MEQAQAGIEEQFYANLSSTRNDLPAGYPADNTTNPNQKVAKVSGSGQKIGPAIVFKVMAGDKFNLRVSSWYKKNGSTALQPVYPLNDLLTALINGVAGGGKATVQELTNTGILTPGMSSFLTNQTSEAGKPKAHVNWVLFDEQFNMVASNSSYEQVGSDQEFKVHTRSNLPVDKSGYLYVYVSNQTPNINVFFDNLQVTHIRGPILEESHYYPFGLTMAGISSKAAGGLENKKKYNGIEFENDLDLNTYDAFFRELDPQIGRWWQQDPEIENMEACSPYASNYDNPITYSDPLGDFPDGEGDGPGVWETVKAVGSALVNLTTAATDRTLNAVGHTLNQVVTSAGGVVTGVLHTLTFGATPTTPLYSTGWTSEQTSSFNTGVTVGQVGGVLFDPAAVAGAPATGAKLVTGSGTQVLVKPSLSIPRVSTSSNSSGSSNRNSTQNNTPKKRVVNQKPGEKALNQVEGINKAKVAAAKNKVPGQKRQTKIYSIKKSEQNLGNELKKIKSLKDAKENF